MLTEQQLHGIYVPIITPFTTTGELDLESFHSHMCKLLASGIHGLVINGTTGECPTITRDEVKLLMAEGQSIVGNSGIPLVLGTGTNDTATTIQNTERAGHLGADGVLVVVPYYNRPSQEGIIEHYRRAAQVGVPVIAYDIPYRTGVKLDVETVRKILDIDGVIGLKDSSGSTQLITELSRKGSKPVLCGEDTLLYASLCLGAQGGMPAAANMEAERFVKLYNQFAAGQTKEAKHTFDELYPLIRLLFSEPNPAPLKWLLKEQGVIATGELRLPMTPISADLQQQLVPYI